MTWNGVRRRVDALAGDGRSEAVFGARRHRFRLAPPLSDAQVSEIEAACGVVLPEDYREFLVRVGAGGAGPWYGIATPTSRDGGWDWVDDAAETDSATLSRPFLDAPARTAVVAEYDAREPTRDGFDDDETYRNAFRAWDDEWDTVESQLFAGSICLCHYGCGVFLRLVVTGAERGTMWSHDGGPADLTPLGVDGRRVSFSQWYLDWLEESERTTRG
ncbi:hypothetical protein LX16_5030 [Stackebrandtia albiflava]|uniref:Knr4/Smi1-like domain-containing protein n=1 Tax=Stackebrandtia albiflava TaxID=406432 RepID=A0A562UPM5_9ACTN|nr:SMI1/KNR4 family protein [Stackebrandtia albiflava]TWJ07546.1 hypothetical protein LX16_5030 [Stackebrandtia albiflava]